MHPTTGLTRTLPLGTSHFVIERTVSYPSKMVRYREIAPPAALSAVVACYWMLEDDGGGAAPQRVVPDGRCELILNWERPFEVYRDGEWREQPRTFLAGQLEGPLLLRSGGRARILGIRFHPHGAEVLAGPVNELTERFTSLEDLSPRLARCFDRVLEARDPIAAVNAALTPMVGASRMDDVAGEAARRIIVARGGCDLASLARDLGIGLRQLERRFQAAVGLPPKVFCRIQRFQRVFQALEATERNWVTTAVECGFYDQAHLIRDCRALSGTTPAVLLSEGTDLARQFLSGAV